MTDPMEDELRAAFRAAAKNITPDPTAPNPFDAQQVVEPMREQRLGARRWLLPAAAAAAAIAVMVPFLLMRAPSNDVSSVSSAAPTLPAGVADVAGVRFPIPDGTVVREIGSATGTQAVCVSAEPSEGCGSGVTITVGLPQAGGAYETVSDPSYRPGCQMIMRQDSPQLLDGRPAVALQTGCKDTATGPWALTWYLTDGTLSIQTPVGVAGDEAKQIAAGLDLQYWGNHGGEPVVQQTSASN